MKFRAASTTLRERSRLVVLLNHSHLPTRYKTLVRELIGWKQGVYFAYVEAVDTTGQGMQVQHDVHAVLLDGVVCDSLEVLLLVARVVPSPRDLEPCCICGGDTNEVHAARCQLVDVFGGDICCVALLEDRVTLVTELDTAVPLIDGPSAVLVPPV